MCDGISVVYSLPVRELSSLTRTGIVQGSIARVHTELNEVDEESKQIYCNA